MIIYGGLSGLWRTVSPSRWSRGLDADFTQYVVEGLRRLVTAQAGIDVYLVSGFRTYAQQARLYAQNPSKAARPGLSQHEYGYAVDLSITLPPVTNPYPSWFQTLIALISLAAPAVVDYQDLDSQGFLELIWGDLLYPRSNDPGHLSYYSDRDWHDALQAAGYLVSPETTPVTYNPIQMLPYMLQEINYPIFGAPRGFG
jgi:hypothetical protein